jgi:hypothetical protein
MVASHPLGGLVGQAGGVLPSIIISLTKVQQKRKKTLLDILVTLDLS